MALTNVLGNGTYTVVENVIFNRAQGICSLQVVTYSHADKAMRLSMFTVDIEGNGGGYPVEAMQSAPPETPEEGDAYIVTTPAAEGPWAGLDGKIVAWNGMQWDTMEGFDEAFVAATGKVYRSTSQGWQEDKRKVSPSDFDTWFGIDAIGGTSNLVRQAYLFLKTLPEFANAQDVLEA